MQLNSDFNIKYLIGDSQIVSHFSSVFARPPFDDEVVEFLNDLSRELMKSGKSYSDVITFAFWIRRANINKLKERFSPKEGINLGRGLIFHIAPSNVPVNFAYSLVSGLLFGNANLVRVPSKEFPQTEIIVNAMNKILEYHENIKNYIVCVRYEHDKNINDLFSGICDVRIIWGGDNTISEIRKSPLQPRTTEITFADRYSLTVIDSGAYLAVEDKKRIAENFYNDTFFSDQNACTSPKIIIWTGKNIEKAKEVFWSLEHDLVKVKYSLQPIQAVNKLTTAFLIASKQNVILEPHEDNLIIRVKIYEITDNLMNYRDNSGYFYEYNCENIMEIKKLCNSKQCQTIGYVGDVNMFLPLVKSGIKGVDRIVPVGRTMDFDLIWDGYNLAEYLTRKIMLS